MFKRLSCQGVDAEELNLFCSGAPLEVRIWILGVFVFITAFTIRERAPFMLAFFLLQVCKIINMDLSVKPDQLIPNLYMVEMFRGQLIN